MSQTTIDPTMFAGGRQPAGPEEKLWQGRPAMRAEIWTLLALVVLVWVGGKAIAGLDQAVAAAGRDMGMWSLAGGLPDLPITGQALLTWTAIVIAGYRILLVRTTSYVLTNQYFYAHRGILSRYHDQLEIHRVRDVETNVPVHYRVLGVGNVVIHSVDRSTPTVKLRAQTDAVELGQAVSRVARAEQERLGYREFEGTAGLSQ
jgi:hypothetical protein